MSTSDKSGKADPKPPLRVEMQIACACGETLDVGVNEKGVTSMRCLACGARPTNAEVQLCLSAAIIEASKFLKRFDEKIQVHPKLSEVM